MSELKIAAVQTFLTQPCGQRLIVVKVLTSQAGLYGLGCATFTQRHMAVKAALDHHVGPFAVGRSASDIEDFWQAATPERVQAESPPAAQATGMAPAAGQSAQPRLPAGSARRPARSSSSTGWARAFAAPARAAQVWPLV